LIALFSVTALANAFLLFWVEPLFARMVLPLLGGAPSVWNTCLMFFQTALLGGYLYVHLTSRYLGPRPQAALHLALLALSLAALPVAIPPGWTPPVGQPVVPLLLLLTTALGMPFFLLSATAPLLQRWLAATEHPAAANPYQLYAASNAGSFLGLLAFPAVLEPALGVARQSGIWTVGYLLAGGLTALCALVAWRQATTGSAVGADEPAVGPGNPSPPTSGDRIRWVVLAFVPSSLLLGVTTHLTTDVAAVPFLWVLPLGIYLLTFIAAFARTGRARSRLPLELHALAATAFMLVAFWAVDLDHRAAYPLHLGLFGLTALVLHGELAARRPGPRHLTGFYLWLALGGALGGAFNALVAPVLFDSTAEYIPMIVLACFLRPTRPAPAAGLLERAQAAALAMLPALLMAVAVAFGLAHRRGPALAPVLVSLAAGALALALRANAPLFGSSLAAVGVAGLLLFRAPQAMLHQERSFYGAYRVMRVGEARLLYHGTTIHGAQFADSARRNRPLTYYHPAGPVGEVFETLGARLDGKRIGVVGLGAGSLLCHGRPGQRWTFYEIDAAVERIARDPAYFTFLRDCPVPAGVVLGDARLTLAREPDARYALLVLDAFSSDAIPVHLLTREALATYLRLLEPGGALLLHISNQHLRLEPVVAALARDAGLTGLVADRYVPPSRESKELEYGCDWVVLTREPSDFVPAASDRDWRALAVSDDRAPWTDDYSNVFRAIIW
jgi:hypothetical protein